MRRMKLIAALGIVVAVTGCATAEGYRQHMSLLNGAHSDQIQVDWGPPDNVTKLSDGNELWIYNKVTVHHTGNSYSQVATGSYEEEYTDKKGKKQKRTITTYDSVWVPPDSYTTHCETRFVVSPDHRIISSGFDGPDCVAKELKSSAGDDA